MNILSFIRPADSATGELVKDSVADANTRKQYFLTILFSATSIFFLTLFGATSLAEDNDMLAWVCLGGAILNVANLIFLHITGKYREACRVIVVLMTGLTLYLICYGGTNNTGPLWFYVMPLLIFYVFELKNGLVTLIILESIIAAILLLPSNPLLFTSYDTDFVSRFLASLFAVSLLAFAYEFSRKDWQKELLVLNILLEKMSRTDELTGMTNRRDMNSRIEEELARFKQNRRPFSLIMGDLDNFKKINDSHGHNCGDIVLQKVSQTLDNETKQQDKISRWGGEEFLILLPETNLEEGRLVAERLRAGIEKLVVEYGTSKLQLTMSFGVAEFNGSDSLLECLKEVDNKLYLSKERGKNCVS